MKMAADASGISYAPGDSLAIGTEDIVLYAIWENSISTVTFESNGGSNVENINVFYGDTITVPSDPTFAGHTFKGWYKQAELTNKWEFDVDTVTSDIMLYAKWTENTYTVTFDSNGGSAVGSIGADYGDTITAPSDPTFAGHTSEGWYKQPELTNKWEFDVDTVISDFTLYAKWTENTYTVTFVDFNGDILKTQNVAYGNAAAAPELPVREGYTFKSWNEDFNHVTSDLTITAKYSLNAPIIHDVWVGDIQISGTEVVGAVVSVIFPNAIQATATVDASGEWVIDVPALVILHVQDEIKAIQKDIDGILSDEAIEIVQMNNGTADSNNPKTGDSPNKNLWLGWMILIIYCTILVVIIARHYGEKETKKQ